MTLSWRIEMAHGPAASLLEASAATGDTQRTVRFLDPVDKAVVLGSTQPESHIDRARAGAAGTAVLRRRSGGGAVLVGPGEILWTEVVIPTGDPLWTTDVGRAFWWLGDVWAAALSTVGLDGVHVWHGGLVRSPLSDRVCFAGLGSGEVTVGVVKVVGLSQRRTRAGAHFQCAIPIVWDPSALLAVMALDNGARTQAAMQLAGAAMGVGADVGSRLGPAFLEQLP